MVTILLDAIKEKIPHELRERRKESSRGGMMKGTDDVPYQKKTLLIGVGEKGGEERGSSLRGSGKNGCNSGSDEEKKTLRISADLQGGRDMWKSPKRERNAGGPGKGTNAFLTEGEKRVRPSRVLE